MRSKIWLSWLGRLRMNKRRPVQLDQDNELLQGVNREFKENKRQIRRRKRRKRLKQLSILLMIGLVVYGCYLFDQSDHSRISTIKIAGNEFYQDEEILAAAKLQQGSPMISNLPIFVKQRVQKLPLVEKASVNVYYNKGYLSIDIQEVPAVAYSKNDVIQFYFKNGMVKDANADTFDMIAHLPLLSGFAEEALSPKLFQQLGSLPEDVFLAISEIYHIPKELDPTAMKMAMNDEYFVYLSIETLPMLKQYATLVNGADEFNKCIDMIEYGPTEESQTAILRRCD